MKNSYIFEYLDENDFRKKERSVRKYNMLAGPHTAALMLTSRQKAGSEILGPFRRVLGVLNPNRGNHSNLHMCVSL